MHSNLASVLSLKSVTVLTLFCAQVLGRLRSLKTGFSIRRQGVRSERNQWYRVYSPAVGKSFLPVQGATPHNPFPAPETESRPSIFSFCVGIAVGASSILFLVWCRDTYVSVYERGSALLQPICWYAIPAVLYFPASRRAVFRAGKFVTMTCLRSVRTVVWGSDTTDMRERAEREEQRDESRGAEVGLIDANVKTEEGGREVAN